MQPLLTRLSWLWVILQKWMLHVYQQESNINVSVCVLLQSSSSQSRGVNISNKQLWLGNIFTFYLMQILGIIGRKTEIIIKTLNVE